MNTDPTAFHSQLQALRATMARLRAPGGCPWDIEQTHHSLRRYLIEETAELLDTLDRLDYDHMKEELGDVLLQVYFHAQIAEDNGRFDLEEVAAAINEKLIRRHPHVFGDMELNDADAVLRQWEELKKIERSASGKAEKPALLKELPPKLPATLYAADLVRQLRKKNLQWPEQACRAEVETLQDTLNEQEAGRQLFVWVAACQANGIDPEAALRTYAGQVEQGIVAVNQPVRA